MNWVEGWGAVVACVVDGKEGVMASPALGGGGTVACALAVGGCGTAPGWGGGGDWVDVEVGRVDVGVGMRLPVGSVTAAVGAGRLGAAPG